MENLHIITIGLRKKEQLLNDVQKARNDIKLGKGTKIDELEKESLTW